MFKKINGYPNYEINEDGVIRSIPRNGTIRRTRIIVGGTDRSGYKIVGLRNKPDKKDTFKVHRLVAEHFIPNPENKKTVNHKDGNKQNNKVSNLEWATQIENHLHGYRMGLWKDVDFYEYLKKDLNGNLIAKYNSLREAERLSGVSRYRIKQLCKDKYVYGNDIDCVWERVTTNPDECKGVGTSVSKCEAIER
jgi:hypothetical protein